MPPAPRRPPPRPDRWLPWRVRMRPAEPVHNVELRLNQHGQESVVFAFPYRSDIVDAVRAIPGRRFDWQAREWWAPADDWGGAHVADIRRRFPQLRVTRDAAAWLDGLGDRWIGRVTTGKHQARGWFICETRAGTLPVALSDRAMLQG